MQLQQPQSQSRQMMLALPPYRLAHPQWYVHAPSQKWRGQALPQGQIRRLTRRHR